MKYPILILVLLLAGTGMAEDKTPYNLAAVGTNRGTQSITWITEYIDLLSHYRNVGAVVYDSILDSAVSLNPDFKAGFYGSSQEVNAIIYDSYTDYNTQYAERLEDTTDVWFWLLIKHYLDSIGVSTDSACIAWLDTTYATINDGRGDGRGRLISESDTLDYNKTFVSYQTFDNDADDTAFFPAGYAWFANGGNADVRRAIAYAFRRRIWDVAFRAAVEGGSYRAMNYLFMDNQYANAEWLGSYWSMCTQLMWYDGVMQPCDASHCPDGEGGNCDSIESFTTGLGGPTAGIDFSNGYTDINTEGSGSGYYEASTLMIDSVLKLVLDSTAAANGYDSIETFANVRWADSGDALAPADYVSGIFLEGPIQPDRTAGLWNTQWKISAGLILDHDTTMALYMVYGSFGGYFYEGQDRADMAHYCFFLILQNYNEGKFWTYWMGSDYLDWTGSFHNLYTVDLGYPTPDTAMNAHYSGTGWYGATPYRWVKRRTYTSDGASASDTTAVVLFGSTAGASYDWNDDSVAINLADGDQKLWYEIDIDADISAIADSIFYVKPYEGLIVIAAGETGNTKMIGTFKGGKYE